MLHELSRPSSHRRKSIQVGRWNGSGRGNYSTRGLKGQGSRTGFSQQPWFEGWQTPLHMRLPKSRWFKKHFKLINHTIAINIWVLNADDRIKSGDTLSIEVLATLGYIKRGYSCKILGNGELDKALTLQWLSFSATAKTAIEKAGGSIIE